MQAVGHPAEQLALPEHRADQHDVLLVCCAHPGIVGEEHVAFANAGIVAAVLQDPFHLGIGDARHVLHIGAEIDELGILGQDRGVEVERVHGDGRARDALDGGAMLLIYVPKVMADDLEADRIDVGFRLAMQLELGRNFQLLGRHVGIVDAVEGDAGGVVELGHAVPPASRISKLPKASSRSLWPGRTTTDVSGVSTTQGPITVLPGFRRVPSQIAVSARRLSSSQ